MALIWPVDLPQYPLADGSLQHVYNNNVLKGETDVGPGKRRKRYSFNRSVLQCAVVLTTIQMTTFNTFFTQSTQSGVLSFEWDTLTDVSELNNGLWGFQEQAQPRVALISAGHWKVTMSLETRLQ